MARKMEFGPINGRTILAGTQVASGATFTVNIHNSQGESTLNEIFRVCRCTAHKLTLKKSFVANGLRKIPLQTYEEKLLVCERELFPQRVRHRFDSVETYDTSARLRTNVIFQKWAYCKPSSASDALLTLRGKTGAGKSVLMKDTVLSLGTDESTVVLHHFFDSRPNHQSPNSWKRSSNACFRALLGQIILACPEISATYVNAWCVVDKEQRDMDFWTDDQVQESIKDILMASDEMLSSKIIPRRFRIFIDGLDECSDDDGGEEVGRPGPLSILKFATGLLHSLIHAGIDIGICLSRRMFPDYGALEPQTQLIDVGSYLRGGVTKFLETQLGIAGMLDDTLRYDLYQGLMAQSGDGYEWAKFVTEEIQKAAKRLRSDELWAFAEALSNDFDSLYEKTVKSIDFQSDLETLELFQLVLGSLRPLTHLELRHAFAFTDTLKYTNIEVWEVEYGMPAGINFEKRLHHQSRGLIEVVSQKVSVQKPESEDEARAQVRFIHGSVKAFLLGSKGLSLLVPNFTDAHGRSHLRLFQSCVNTIRAGIVCNEPCIQFLDYAYEFWTRHAREAGVLLEGEGVLESLPIYIRKCRPRSELLIQETIRCFKRSQAKETFQIGSKRNMMLLLATMCCTSLLRYHLENCPTCRKICSGEESGSLYFQTALRNAIEGKSIDTVKYLLDYRRGEDINTLSPDGTTLLFTASYTGSQDMVQFLLSCGANPLLPSTSYWELPLHAAIAKRRFHIVKLFLESSAYNVEAALKAQQKVANKGWTALHVAVGVANRNPADMLQMVEIILAATKNRIDLLEIRDEDGKNPLDLVQKVSRERNLNLEDVIDVMEDA